MGGSHAATTRRGTTMAPSSKAKRRKSVPSAMEKAWDEAARQKQKKKRKRGGKKRSLDGADVEAAHERAEQARAVHDMASRAATASQTPSRRNLYRASL